MNTPNPLVPQGTNPAGGKSTVRNTILTIVVVHVAFIGSLLFWGCSKDTPKKDEAAIPPAVSNTDPVYPVDSAAAASSNSLVSTMSTPTTSVSTPIGSTSAAPITPGIASTSATTPLVATPLSSTSTAPISSAPTTLTPTLPPTAPVGSGTEYTVAKGDSLAVIAKNNHVSLKALQDANPGVDSKKLRPGQKLQIPAAVAATATATGTPSTAGSTEAAPAGESYTVKAGDNLVRIAKNHHTTVKAIVALNGLKSQNSLKVGQKLKMPAPKAATPTPAESNSTATSPTASAAGAVSPLTPAAHAGTTLN